MSQALRFIQLPIKKFETVRSHLSFMARGAIFILAGALVINGCAKEPSDEERRRETENRDSERLKKAEGSYLGFVQVDSSHVVPLALILSATKNPQSGTDKPALAGSLRIGLFGGVTIASDSTSFDWGNGNLAISFKRNAGAPLELRGTIGNNSIDGAVLSGPNTGDHAATLSTTGINLFSEASQYIFDAAAGSSPDVKLPDQQNAQFALKRSNATVKAPDTSDLPLLPPLDAALQFYNLGASPQSAKSMNYDPLTGTIEIHFTDTSRLNFEHIYLNNSARELGLAGVALDSGARGTLTVGATTEGYVAVRGKFPGLGLGDTATPVTDLPPVYYVGTYQPIAGPAGFTRPVLASFSYAGSQGTNTSEFPFANFPQMRLHIVTCVDSQAIDERELDTAALDPIFRTFQLAIVPGTSPTPGAGAPSSGAAAGAAGGSNGGVKSNAILKYSADFQAFEISYLQSTGTVDPNKPQFKLHATPSATAPTDCKSLASTGKALKYTGYLSRRSDGGKIPAVMEVVPRRIANGSTAAVSLQVNLTVGFFGGVSMSSSAASFDVATGSVAASFVRESGPSLELKFNFQNDSVSDATLAGQNSGTNDLFLTSDGAVNGDMGPTANMQVKFSSPSGQSQVGSELSLTREKTDHPAPPNIDTPTFPDIKVGFKFPALGQTPQSAKSVVYDAIVGSMNIALTDSAHIEISRLYLSETNNVLTAPTQLQGQLINGSTLAANLELNVHKPSDPGVEIAALPPPSFKGTYQTSIAGGSRTFPSVAKLVYTGNQGGNTGEMPFPTFPNLRLEIEVCDAGTGQVQKEYVSVLNSLDYIGQIGVFLPMSSSGVGTPSNGHWVVSATQAWTVLDGVFSTNDTSTTPTDTTAKVHLEAQPIGGHGCSN